MIAQHDTPRKLATISTPQTRTTPNAARPTCAVILYTGDESRTMCGLRIRTRHAEPLSTQSREALVQVHGVTCGPCRRVLFFRADWTVRYESTWGSFATDRFVDGHPAINNFVARQKRTKGAIYLLRDGVRVAYRGR